VTDKLILKGINGASQSEIRLSVMQDVWEKLGPQQNASSQKKLLF
jgi:hypothetical protein